jgi:hypothetical protein
MPGYVATGPFVNGSAPAIAAAFLNNLESWIQQTEGTQGGSSVSGSTSGTATLYQALQGTVKYVLIVVSVNYNSTLKTIALPTAFTARADIRVDGNAGPIRFLSSGTARAMNLITGFNGTTGVATTVSVTSITAGGLSRGEIAGAFDTVEFSATGAVGPYIVILEGS